MKYTLIDGVRRNRQYPNDFQIPTPAEKAMVQPGSFVKIGAEFKIHPDEKDDPIMGERFWVIVSEIKGSRYRGIINNDLVYTPNHGLMCDHFIDFEARHILATQVRRLPPGMGLIHKLKGSP
jgi:hypothetical protein